MKPLVIIGSGAAGYLLAKEWRKYDAQTPLYIITAHAGYFYSKPPLSAALRLGKTAEELQITTTAAMAEQLQAEILEYTVVTHIDRDYKQIITQDGRQIAYGRLVLALGAEPIDLGLPSVLSINHLADYAQFRNLLEQSEHIAILGAGLVACELANDLLSIKRRVSIIAASPHPLPGLLPKPLAEAFQQVFTAQGIEWHLQKTAHAVAEVKNGKQLQLNDGSIVEADCVLSAVGIRPHLELARHAGLKTLRGIQVDLYCRTSDAAIYALGDCAEVAGQYLPFIAPLMQCVRALAKTLAGEETPVEYPPMPIVVKTPLCPTVTYPFFDITQGAWTYEGTGSNRAALFHALDQKLLGFALMGECVAQRADYVQQLRPLEVSY